MGEALATAIVSRRWFFAAAVFDEAQRSLTVGGEPVRLEPKPLELLQHLLLHAGKVQTKDELFDAVWPGRVLTENVLTKAVARLRQVLNDDDQTIIATSYKYGYRFAAEVRVESIPVDTAIDARSALSAGDRPPLRPLWKLERRLGGGGQGDVWLGVHEKIGERRVFKFAVDAESLNGLKREITLYRLLRQTLGDRAPVVRLIDWNLEQAPYFLESEWLMAGSLADWLTTDDGAAAAPLAERLELMARIADALACIHQVGVLHKDLKPANVLLRPNEGGVPQVLLCDLGSGGVLDAQVLQRLKITQMATIAAGLYTGPSSATPLYLAPEVLAGQPSTIKSDIYALGVMLYQVAAGDLCKPWMPGWERDIADDLLREDIACAADGDPARRCSDAGVFAESLRTLDQRRARRQAEVEAQQKAALAERALDRMRARRNALGLALGIFVLGSMVSSWLYFRADEARVRADASAARARAVSDYLSKDLFAPINDRNEPVVSMTVEQFLQKAADNVDKRLADDPATAAEVHAALGNSFLELQQAEESEVHLRRALELAEKTEGSGASTVLIIRNRLILVEWVTGKLRNHLAGHETSFRAGIERLGENAPEVRALQFSLASARYWMGNLPRCETELEVVHDAELTRPDPSANKLGTIELELGRCQHDLDRNNPAAETLRSAIRNFTVAHGDRHIDTARARLSLGLTLIDLGRLGEAQSIVDRATKDVPLWSGAGTWHIDNSRYALAHLNNERGHPELAEAPLAEIIDRNDSDPAVIDQSGPLKQLLADVQIRLGRFADAEAMLRRGLANAERDFGADSLPAALLAIQLAEILVLENRARDARQVLAALPLKRLEELGSTHPSNLRLEWVRALVKQAEGDKNASRAALQASLVAYGARYGAGHWRTRRVEAALSQIDSRH